MAWIRRVPPGEATGELKEVYDGAIRRAGKVFQILQVQSLRPKTLRAGLDLYLKAMMYPSELSRVQREILAVIVSAANRCRY